MENFDEFGLPESLMHTLKHMEFTKPTPIQAQAIPHALKGRDILGSAQTGTGKTGAFGIPVVARLHEQSRGTALIMTPTRELATQVMTQLKAMLGKYSKIKTALLIGGESMPKQLQQLKNRPRLLVGTPGRINDHLERGSLMLHDTNFLVLDETDRMLDMGFTIQIEKIMKFMPQTRQTMLFSATLPKDIVKISQQYLKDPVRVSVSDTSSPAKNIKHEMIRVTDGEKYDRLLQELDAREGSIIMFVKTKHGTERMAGKLARAGYAADAIHGDLRQSKRDRVIANFRDKKYRILVATDVAARGLDISHIEHVINYDLPQCAEDYIHRIGRTARAGAQGEAICLVSPTDSSKWRAIHKLMDPEAAAAEEENFRRSKRKTPQAKRPRRRGDRKKMQGQEPQEAASNHSKPKASARRNAKPTESKPANTKPVRARSEGATSGEAKAKQPRRRSERKAQAQAGGAERGAGKPSGASKGKPAKPSGARGGPNRNAKPAGKRKPAAGGKQASAGKAGAATKRTARPNKGKTGGQKPVARRAS